jgi:hypothetical protein
MRRRLRPTRQRSMARRSGLQGGPAPGSRLPTYAGWLAAILLVAGAAFVVGRIGEPEAPSPSPSVPALVVATPLPIAFGGAIDDVTGEVAESSRTTEFATGETFAYSVRLPAPAGTTTIHVEVVRIGGGPQETVQEPSPQTIAADATVIAFTVPVDALLRDFGPGEYVMRAYLQPTDEAALAAGRFEVIGPAPAAS